MLTKSQIKFVRSLNSKKVRDDHGVFVAEGPKVVEELLQAPNIQVQDVFATTDWAVRFAGIIEDAAGAITEVDEPTLNRFSALSTPNKVVAVFSKPYFETPPNFENTLSLMLDDIQDPGNMGTIIRCADWFGVPYIICSSSCADAYNAKVVQSTMGSIGRVQVLTADLGEFIEAHSSIPVYAATLDGESIHNHRRITEGFLLIGNESKGIKDDLLALSNHRVTIPRNGSAESLNAAVATAIILSHVI